MTPYFQEIFYFAIYLENLLSSVVITIRTVAFLNIDLTFEFFHALGM